jgi:hypothetical protein
MKNAVLFQHTYKCKVEQLKEQRLVSEKVTEKGTWTETETVHEPMFRLTLGETEFHQLLEDISGTMWEREVKKKHSSVEKAYHEYLVLLNLYR